MMPNTADTYSNLITSQHADKPKFVSTVGVTTSPNVDVQALYSAILESYDIDTAEGTQLDTVGQIVGASRYLTTPLTGVYFEFDTLGVGYDTGVWLGPYDSVTGLTSLPDEFYRLLIRSRILHNHWDGSKGQFYALAEVIFGPSGYTYFIDDHADLTISIGLLGPTNPPPILTALLNSGALDVKPVTIRIMSRVAQQGPIFGFDLNTLLFKGFDTGYWAIPL